MAGNGGYQAPSRPAAASGPGKYSQRTDTAPKFRYPDAAYGENSELATQQAGAPMARTAARPQAGGAGGTTPTAGPPDIVGIGADSQRPDEPVTAGVDIGPGPGSEVLPGGPQPATGELSDMMFQLAATDRTGAIAALAMQAMRRGL
jgi:hypothetical protein